MAVCHYDMTEGQDKWLDLGTFMFAGGGLDCVRLLRTAAGRAPQPEDVKFDLLQRDGITVRTATIVKAEGGN
jgi:hypothetical protein